MFFYILDGKGKPVESDIRKWSEWFEGANRTLCRTEIRDITISTVFLGIDHSFDGGTPVLWETMVFGGSMHGEELRYTSRLLAEEGHYEMVKKVYEAEGLKYVKRLRLLRPVDGD
jgi:hypothetical protein